MRKTFYILSIGFTALIIIFSGCSSTEKLKQGEVIDKRNRAAGYATIGSHHYDEAEYDQALDFFFLALKQNILIDNDRGIIESYNSIGNTYLAAGKIVSAERYYEKAMEIAKVYNDRELLIRCKNNQGEIYLTRGDYTAALNLFKEAFGDISDPEKSKDSAILLHNIGVAYKRLDNYQEAEKYLLRSIKLNKENNKFKELASDNYILSSLYSKRKQYSDALVFIDKALEFDKRTENSYGIAKDLYAKGIIQKKSDSVKESYYTFKRDALIYESLNIPVELIQCLKQLENLATVLNIPKDFKIWQTARIKLEKKIGQSK